MKQLFLLTAVTALLSAGAQGVELNKDAMKAMQQEGHRIVEESEGGRAYKAANGLCLDVAGEGLVVKKCKGDAKTQKWITDGQSRLVAHNGRCVDGAKLAKCSGAKTQKWKHEGKRLANHNKQCLQAQGQPPKAGAKVVTNACNNKAAAQVWN